MASRRVGGFGGAFRRQNVGALQFFLAEQGVGTPVRIRSSQAKQPRQAPRHCHIDRQRQFESVDMRQLQRFHPTAVLDGVEIDFNFPARRIPVDELHRGLEGGGRPVGQQAPLNGLDALGGAKLLGHYAGRGEPPALAIRHRDAGGKEALTHLTLGVSGPPGQRGGHFGHPFIAFRPARALDEARTLALGVIEFPCPDPGVDDAQRLTLRRHHVSGMQIQVALRLVTERPQAVDGLAIEIQFGGVVQAQYSRVLANTGFGALDVWGQQVFPPQPLPLIAGLVKKTVGRLGLGAIGAGARDARRGLVGKVRCNFDQPLGQPYIAQLRPGNSSIAQLSMLGIALKGPTPYDIRRSLPATTPENTVGV